MSDRPVAVLCGGLGTRLGYPGQKCLVPIAGRPFLHWKLDQLVKHGASEFHLLVAHKALDVYDSIGDKWGIAPVYYHTDDLIGQTAAHRQAAPYMPFVHWLTYGDGLLDAPLRHSLMPYRYANDEFSDAGLMYCWAGSFRFIPKHIDAPSYHINTPEDLERTSAYLHRLG